MKNAVLPHTKYLAMGFIFLFTLPFKNNPDSRPILPDQVQIKFDTQIFTAPILLGSQKYLVIAGEQFKASDNI